LLACACIHWGSLGLCPPTARSIITCSCMQRPGGAKFGEGVGTPVMAGCHQDTTVTNPGLCRLMAWVTVVSPGELCFKRTPTYGAPDGPLCTAAPLRKDTRHRSDIWAHWAWPWGPLYFSHSAVTVKQWGCYDHCYRHVGLGATGITSKPLQSKRIHHCKSKNNSWV
jgi:hypothetical protein